MQPARVADGTAFAGNTWTDVVLLPTHRTNPDGTQGASINWSTSVFTADAPNAPTGVTITVTPNLSATPPTVTLSMSEATTSLLGGVFRWYLRESVVYGGDVLLWRLVRVGAEGGAAVGGTDGVIQLTVPTDGDVIAAVLPESVVDQVTAAALAAETSARQAADLLLLPLDGARPMTGDLPLGGHKATGAGDATTPTGLTTLQQVQALITAVVDGSPGALDTLKELADALGDDANFATTITNLLAAKASTASVTSAISAQHTADNGVFQSLLTPTVTRTAPYSAAVGDLAMMNVPGGAATLTLPTAPADKAQVGYRAVGATTAAPLTVTAGGSDTIGTGGLTTVTVALVDESAVLQYEAVNARWLAVSNVKTQASLDARYPVLDGTGKIPAAQMRPYNFRGNAAAFTTYNPWDIVLYSGRRILITATFTTSSGTPPFISAANYTTALVGGQDWYAADFGAIADGAQSSAATNTTAIQAAINAANPSNLNTAGGRVYLPAGNLLINGTLSIPSGVELWGQGKFGTYMGLADGANCHMIVNRVSTGGGVPNAEFMGVRHLGLDCRGQYQGNVIWTDGVTTASSNAVSSATHTFTNGEVIRCNTVGWSGGTATVVSGGGTHSAVLDRNSTVTATGVTMLVPAFTDGAVTAGSSTITSAGQHVFVNGEFVTGSGVQPGTAIAGASGGTGSLVQPAAASVTLNQTPATLTLGDPLTRQTFGANTLGLPSSGTVQVFPTISASPVTVTYTGKTYATLTGCTIAAGSQAITTSSWVSVAAQQTLTAATFYTAASQYHGIYLSMNPLSTSQSGDWGFDPTHRVEDVYVKNAHDDGIHIDGRSDIVLSDCKVSFAGGNSYKLSFDTHVDHCAVEVGAWHGFVLGNSSTQLTGCKSYNTGQTKTTAAAQPNAAHGYFVTSAGVNEVAFAGCDAQQNSGHGFAFIGLTAAMYGMAVAGCTVSQTSFGTSGAFLTQGIALHLENCNGSVINLTNGNNNTSTATFGVRLIAGSNNNDITMSHQGTGIGASITSDSVLLQNAVRINGVNRNAPAQFSSNAFGDGSDGPLTFDGTTVVAGITPSSNIYTATHDLHATTLVVNAGVTLVARGVILFAQQTITNNGTIHADGSDATSFTGPGYAGGAQGGGAWGASGGTGNATAGSAGSGGLFGGAAGAGGVGGTGAAGAAGSAGGSTNAALLRHPFHVLAGVAIAFNSAVMAMRGGSGGGGGGGDGTNRGGGGGTGGGILTMLSPAVANSGTLSAKGGAGFTPTVGNAGGGGGGGGGYVLAYTTSAWQQNGTTVVTGGAAGAGFGTGATGTSGSTGSVLNVILA